MPNSEGEEMPVPVVFAIAWVIVVLIVIAVCVSVKRADASIEAQSANRAIPPAS